MDTKHTCKSCFKEHIGSYLQEAFCTECLNNKYNKLLDLRCRSCNDVLTNKDLYRISSIKHTNLCNFCIETLPEHDRFGE